LIKLAMAGVSEVCMPQIAGVLNMETVVIGGMSGVLAQWIEFTGRIISEQNRPC
jgi:hypothetical protein